MNTEVAMHERAALHKDKHRKMGIVNVYGNGIEAKDIFRFELDYIHSVRKQGKKKESIEG